MRNMTAGGFAPALLLSLCLSAPGAVTCDGLDIAKPTSAGAGPFKQGMVAVGSRIVAMGMDNASGRVGGAQAAA